MINHLNISKDRKKYWMLILLCVFVSVEVTTVFVDTVVPTLMEIVEFGEMNKKAENKEESSKKELFAQSQYPLEFKFSVSEARYFHNIKRSAYHKSIPTPPPDLA